MPHSNFFGNAVEGVGNFLTSDPFGVGAALFGPTESEPSAFNQAQTQIGNTSNVGRSSNVGPIPVEINDPELIAANLAESFRERDIFENTNIDTSIGDLTQAGADASAAIMSAIDSANNILDPIRSQFQDLANTPAISDSLRQQLIQSINASSQAAAGRRNEVLAPLAARGLANSSIAQRDTANFARGVSQQNVIDRASLNANVAGINRQQQLGALSGLSGIGTAQAGLGLQGGISGAQFPFNAALGAAELNVNRPFTVFDPTNFTALQLGLDAQDFARELALNQEETALFDSLFEVLGPRLLDLGIGAVGNLLGR